MINDFQGRSASVDEVEELNEVEISTQYFHDWASWEWNQGQTDSHVFTVQEAVVFMLLVAFL